MERSWSSVLVTWLVSDWLEIIYQIRGADKKSGHLANQSVAGVSNGPIFLDTRRTDQFYC